MRVATHVAGKQAIQVTPPRELNGVDPSTWSPENLLIAATASCLAVTFTGLAERSGLAYTRLRVDADGAAGLRDDGRFGFTRVVLRLRLDVAPDDEEPARGIADNAESKCLVAASLDLPVETRIEISAT